MDSLPWFTEDGCLEGSPNLQADVIALSCGGETQIEERSIWIDQEPKSPETILEERCFE